MEVRSGAWTAAEDVRLSALVGRQSSAQRWGEIASLISGRTAKQCRERWCYNLDPAISRATWQPAEDMTLIRAQATGGNRWAQIANMLPGRSENAVKTRFKSILQVLLLLRCLVE